MKSFLLKFLIVAALFGIIVVVAITLIGKNDVEQKTYDVLMEKQASINAEVLISNAATVRNSKTVTDKNKYSEASAQMISELNGAIEYYFYYIPVLNELTTNNKTNIVNGYDKYIKALKTAQTNYNSYKATLDATDSTSSSIGAASAHFVLSLNDAYKIGSEFYKQLRSIINKDAYENFSSKNWIYISYEAVNLQADKLISVISSEMLKQKEGQAVTNISTNKAYLNFVALKNYFATNRASGEELSNANISAFVKNYNAVTNIVNFWADVSAYKNALPVTSIERATVEALIDFLTNNTNEIGFTL